MVGFHPEGVIICPREKIPLQGDYNRAWPEYLAYSAVFAWNSEWLNRYDLLGIDSKKIQYKSHNKDNKLFKKIGKLTKLSDCDIIDTIMKPENFRMLEQNLLGSIRQWHFEQIAKKNHIQLREGVGPKEIKIDFVSSNGKTIQVKGRTKSISDEENICVEVKGSHGRIPQRLYKKGAFDFLVVVID